MNLLCVSVILASFGCNFAEHIGNGTGNANNTTGIEGVTVNLNSPLPFILVFMEHQGMVAFSYNITCKNDMDFHVLIFRFQTADDFVFKVMGQSEFTSTCTEVTANTTMNKSETIMYSNTRKDRNASMELSGTLLLNLYGVLIGKTALIMDIRHKSHETPTIDGNPELVSEESLGKMQFPVVVMRKLRTIDHVFQILIYIILILINLSFGCKLDLEVVKASLKKPIAVSIGLGCQYILMPLIGFGVAKIAAKNEPIIALGIFLAGSCPGGGISNIYSHLLNGNLALSITMTTISSVIALAMFPFWVYTLGQQFINKALDSDVNIPFLNIFTTLLVLVVPLLAGIFVKHKVPKLKKFLLRIITPVTVVAIVILLGVGIFSNLYIFKLFRPKVILAGSLLPYIGFIIGGIISAILQQSWKNIKTIALETGFQNVSIAYLVLLTAFPPPDGELAAIAPIAAAVMSPLPPFVLTICYIIYKKCHPEKYKKQEADKNGNLKSSELEPEVEVMIDGTEQPNKDRETDI